MPLRCRPKQFFFWVIKTADVTYDTTSFLELQAFHPLALGRVSRLHCKEHSAPCDRRRVAAAANMDASPMVEFVTRSQARGQCNPAGVATGFPTPWAFTLATLGSTGDLPPAMRSIGIHSVDGTGWLFACRGAPGGTAGGAAASSAGPIVASLCYLAGNYPDAGEPQTPQTLNPTSLTIQLLNPNPIPRHNREPKTLNPNPKPQSPNPKP